MEEPGIDVIDECVIPCFASTTAYDIPESSRPCLQSVVQQFKQLFVTKPGKVNGTYHYITTSGTPVKVPPRRIPVYYRAEIKAQLQQMLDNHIIEESSSSWMAPAVFVKKKSGELRLCVDYRELKKRTSRNIYPLPLPDEVQDCLVGSSIFSTLDLQSGYWQL